MEGAGAFAAVLNVDGASQVVVSTGDLRYRMDQWLRLEALKTLKAEQKKKESAPRHARPNLQNAYVAAGTTTEKKVAAIWQELLGIDKVGIHDNFFELGGHSLLAIQVITRIRTELGAEISAASLFEGPTVQSLSSIIGKDEEDAPSYEHSSERGEKRRQARKQRQMQKQEFNP
jgi:acyl carrier protein